MSIYKERFLKVAREHIKREGIEDLLASLEKTDFFTAPASTRFHDAEEMGLVKHSLGVFDILCTDVSDKYPMETIAIVSLFHDLCKINYYTTEMRNKKDEKGKWIQVPFYTVNDLFPYGHGEKSALLVNEYVKLTPEEMMAIRWHMGAFEPKENYQYLGKAFEMYPLGMYLHFADMKSIYLK